MGYFGLSYVEENADKIKALEVDGGDGCVAPRTETVQDGTYTPLARPLFVYPRADALKRPEVDSFLEYYITNQTRSQSKALFVPMTEEQAAASKEAIDKLVGEAGATS